MYQHTDYQVQLDLYHQRSAEWRSAAVADHLAHEATAGRHRQRRWRWPTRRPRQLPVTAAS